MFQADLLAWRSGVYGYERDDENPPTTSSSRSPSRWARLTAPSCGYVFGKIPAAAAPQTDLAAEHRA